MIYYHSIVCVIFCFIYANSSEDHHPMVKTDQGILRGLYMKSTEGKKISAFLGIPFAKPPVGKLRFQPPLPGEPWNGVFNATQPHAVCVQEPSVFVKSEIPISEDCLYLNVFTPSKDSENGKGYPVMLFIHGGGFYEGSGQIYGPNDLLDYDVIYVNINYRLGAFGFFTTGDEIVPGNNGLKDQVLAMKWVNSNIKYFGGDSKRITLFGHSAGAACVHYHMLSPLSKGLFQNAISQSGTAVNCWGFSDANVLVERGRRLANSLHCPTDNNNDMIKCLQKVETHVILEAETLLKQSTGLVTFIPIMEIKHEGAFLAEHPIDIIKSGKHYQVPWILGITTEDGGLVTSHVFANEHLLSQLNSNFEQIMPFLCMYEEMNYTELRKFYFGENEINQLTRFELVDVIGDLLFIFPSKTWALLHMENSDTPVYFYVFGHKSPVSYSQLIGDKSIAYGTSHADELLLQFPLHQFFGDLKRNDLDVSSGKLLNTMWTNFAKTGNPTPEINALIQTKWEPIKSEDIEYCYIERNIYNSKKLLPRRMNFFKNYNIITTQKNKSAEL